MRSLIATAINYNPIICVLVLHLTHHVHQQIQVCTFHHTFHHTIHFTIQYISPYIPPYLKTFKYTVYQTYILSLCIPTFFATTLIFTTLHIATRLCCLKVRGFFFFFKMYTLCDRFPVSVSPLPSYTLHMMSRFDSISEAHAT